MGAVSGQARGWAFCFTSVSTPGFVFCFFFWMCFSRVWGVGFVCRIFGYFFGWGFQLVLSLGFVGLFVFGVMILVFIEGFQRVSMVYYRSFLNVFVFWVMCHFLWGLTKRPS